MDKEVAYQATNKEMGAIMAEMGRRFLQAGEMIRAVMERSRVNPDDDEAEPR